jgi:hypothetical protein
MKPKMCKQYFPIIKAGKKIIITFLVFIFSFSVFGRNSILNPICFTIAAHQNNLSQLLSLYYEVKDALINSDPATASAKAGELLNAVNTVDVKSFSEAEKKAFSSVQYKLEYDARHISEVKDISHQREHFASLSKNMYALVKSVQLSGQPVYEQYCPMKDAYWLSNETSIKNPYYGSNMLTCGQVKDTLK